MTTADVQTVLSEALDLVANSDDADLLAGLAAVRTFEDSGVLTNDDGLVLRFEDGTEFQVTVVRSR